MSDIMQIESQIQCQKIMSDEDMLSHGLARTLSVIYTACEDVIYYLRLLMCVYECSHFVGGAVLGEIGLRGRVIVIVVPLQLLAKTLETGNILQQETKLRACWCDSGTFCLYT